MLWRLEFRDRPDGRFGGPRRDLVSQKSGKLWLVFIYAMYSYSLTFSIIHTRFSWSCALNSLSYALNN